MIRRYTLVLLVALLGSWALVAWRANGGTLARAASALTRGHSGPGDTIDVRIVDGAITNAMRAHRIPGVSIAMVHHGRIELVKAYGLASLAPHASADTGTRFSIGSVTKQFVAVLALQLQDEGRLSVHDTLAKWYPNLTRAREVTLLDLLNHVSGYRDYYPLDFVDSAMSRPTAADSIIQKFGTLPLDFSPGTRWSYSNTGYMIVGRVLERVTGKSLGTLLRDRIFQPLGLRQTVYEPTASERDPARFATGYMSWALGDPEQALPEAPGWLGAAGGIWSTAADLARWDLALMQPGLLSPEARALLFKERVLTDGSPSGYSAGLEVTRTDGRTVYEHRGAASGFVVVNTFVPADTAAIVLLENGDQNIADAVPLSIVSPPRRFAELSGSTRRRAAPPTPSGPSAADAAADLFRQLQRGALDRRNLGAEYGAFLTPSRAQSAVRSLSPLGDLTGRELLARWERGGDEASLTRLHFQKGTAFALLYRSPDGIIQEYLLW